MNRRRLLQLGATLFAAPAIVRAESLMRVCVVPVPAGEMAVTQRLVAELLEVFARELERSRLDTARFMWGNNQGWDESQGGIITIKRPNFSETRLWPEEE